jgi:hypothetical protein
MFVKFLETGSVLMNPVLFWPSDKKVSNGFLRTDALFWPNEGAMMLEVAK